MAVLCVAPFMVVLDANLVTVALPSIRADLELSRNDLQWVIGTYNLAFGSALLIAGRLGDLWGRPRLLVGGLAVFSLASLGGAVAPSPPPLFVARSLQGLGAAMAFPASLALIASLFEEGEPRNRVLGVYGAVVSGAFLLGVAVGGALTASLGWRSVLLVNVPIGLAAALVARRLVPPAGARTAPVGLDIPGAVAVAGSVLALLYGLAQAARTGWLSGSSLALLALGIGLAVAAGLVERRSPAPLLDGYLLRRRTLNGAAVAALLTVGAGVGTTFVLTLYLQDVIGYGSVQAGLALTPLGVAGVLAGFAAPTVARRVGAAPTVAGALAVQAAGVALLTPIGPGGSLGLVLAGTAVFGIGHFGSTVMFTALGTTGIPEQSQGVAMGLINSAQQIGGAIGLALLVAVASARTGAVHDVSTREAVTEGFRWALGVGSGLSALAAILVLVIVHARRC